MTDSSINAATYAENVRREMRDLPADTVADLTDGLEADIAASLADGAELPPAADYARDLLRAAGIEPTDAGAGGIATRIVRTAERNLQRLTRRAHGLEPAWWVFRAWVLMQLLGFLVSSVDSPYWFLGQWGGEGASNGFVGVIFFVIFLVASVRMGRDGWLLKGRGTKVVSTALGVIAVAVMFAQNDTRGNQGWFTYGNPGMNTSPQRCVEGAPYMLNKDLRSAVDELTMNYDFPYRVVDEATGYDLTTSAGLPSIPVLRQVPDPGELMCATDLTLYLYVNTASGDPTLITSTTAPTATTTSTTVAKQKATTTSTP